jgi:hypothetical protein
VLPLEFCEPQNTKKFTLLNNVCLFLFLCLCLFVCLFVFKTPTYFEYEIFISCSYHCHQIDSCPYLRRATQLSPRLARIAAAYRAISTLPARQAAASAGNSAACFVRSIAAAGPRHAAAAK